MIRLLDTLNTKQPFGKSKWVALHEWYNRNDDQLGLYENEGGGNIYCFLALKGVADFETLFVLSYADAGVAYKRAQAIADFAGGNFNRKPRSALSELLGRED